MEGRKGQTDSTGTVPDDLLTRQQAARLIGVAKSTVRRWADSGRLHEIPGPDGVHRIRRAEAEFERQRVDRTVPSRGGEPPARPPGLDAWIFRLIREKKSPQEIVETVGQPFEMVYRVIDAYVVGDIPPPSAEDLKQEIIDELRPEFLREVRVLRGEVKALEAQVDRALEHLTTAADAAWRASYREKA